MRGERGRAKSEEGIRVAKPNDNGIAMREPRSLCNNCFIIVMARRCFWATRN